jgi:sigma-B regulation protein RsbU (phosphoserine phosphatase)
MGIVVGDVSGHGVGPAMLMAETRAYLRALAREGHGLHGILTRANDYLYRDTDADKFVTLFLGELDPDRRRFNYASAGHETAYILNASGEVKTSLQSTTTPLGLFESMSIEPMASIDLQPGDILVVLTDGVVDAARGDEDFFGPQRALDVVRRHRSKSAQEIVGALHHAVREFLGPYLQEDDLTALVVKVLDL